MSQLRSYYENIIVRPVQKCWDTFLSACNYWYLRLPFTKTVRPARTRKSTKQANGNAAGKVRKNPTGIFRYCPFISTFLNSKPEEYQAIKFLLGFPFGCLLAFGLHTAVLARLELPQFLLYAVSGLFFLGLGLGYAVSVQVRCISLLMIPTFSGKSGRSYLMAFALTYLLSGPISNIVVNSKEITRSLSCNRELVTNITRAKADLSFRPIREILMELQQRVATMDSNTSQVAGEFLPLREEVRDDKETMQLEKEAEYIAKDDEEVNSKMKEINERNQVSDDDEEADKIQKQFAKKMDYRCTDIFNSAIRSCKRWFMTGFHKCRRKLGIINKICDVVKWVAEVCNLASSVPKLVGVKCDANTELTGFGEEFEASEKATNEFSEGFKANMQYKIVEGEAQVDEISTKAVSQAIEHEFDSRKVWVERIVVFIKRIVTFFFIKVIVSSYDYHKKFVSDFKFENFIMTGYFFHIEDRRKVQNKLTLVPLKRIEAAQMARSSQLGMTKTEIGNFIQGTMRLAVRILAFTLIFVIDALLYEVLDLLNRHCHITVTQEGEHSITLKIIGTSVMSDLIRSVIGSINKQHALKEVASNLVCLPRPLKLKSVFIWKISCVFLIIWIFQAIEAYALRLRRFICAFFYPKREKKRIVFLYNDMLKKRRGFQKHARRECRRKALRNKLTPRITLLRSLIGQYPRMFGWLRMLPGCRDHCLMCDEMEQKSFMRCNNDECFAGYCYICWQDINGHCYACRSMDSDWTTDSDEGDQGFDD